jgi:hypothetical protein
MPGGNTELCVKLASHTASFSRHYYSRSLASGHIRLQARELGGCQYHLIRANYQHGPTQPMELIASAIGIFDSADIFQKLIVQPQSTGARVRTFPGPGGWELAVAGLQPGLPLRDFR